MHRATALLIFAASLSFASDFDGASALEFTRKVVAFGPRPPASEAIVKLQRFIISQLKQFGCEVIEDPFTANTPLGPKSMKNIMVRFPGKSGRRIVITGHYDTKVMPGTYFVGANDGGSSAGFLLEMARVLVKKPRVDDVWLVWFDGEEAFAQWTQSDSLYGSRHLAKKWEADGSLAKIKALINVDMIGDKDLGILNEGLSTEWLRRLVWQTAADLGYGRYFLNEPSGTEDDHVPFLQKGVPSLDLIDFNYGTTFTNYWHTDKDTMDKLGANSFKVVGDVLLEVIRRLESLK
jgi:Zn-dependent M28 family amino/carboxypeptidase